MDRVEGRHRLDLLVNTLPPPCLIHEDEHLLVVNKPAGWNTHAPAPYAGEGIYDWLRNREKRWERLAIIHRLDKDTSGVLLFSKTELANRSLTQQFTGRAVKKTYLLLTDREGPSREKRFQTYISRAGDRYLSRENGSPSDEAITRFHAAEPWTPLAGPPGSKPLSAIKAEPLTGRTHQVRVHAAACGFPVLGDNLYGGTPAPRLCLHALQLTLKHPETRQPVTFSAPPDFDSDPHRRLRQAVINPQETTAFRLLHGAADAAPAWYVDVLGDYLLSQAPLLLDEPRKIRLLEYMRELGLKGAAHKTLTKSIRGAQAGDSCPAPVFGATAPERFQILENGIKYEVSFSEGYSVGLFLDQRDNRRRLLTRHVGPGFELPSPQSTGHRSLLNTFSYTCAFSVCAAKAGFVTTSLDLSKKYLAWGADQFRLNDLDPATHDFVYGDTFEWLRRWTKKDRRFDMILLDPPTFSTSRASGVFRAEKDYGKLVAAALPLLTPNGVLFASCNAQGWPAADFIKVVQRSIAASGRRILQSQYVPQPPDFPISREEPAYLKTIWLRLS